MTFRNSSALDRRTVLALVGSGSAAVAGCLGGDDGTETLPATEASTDQVPDAYRTATSLNGNQRDPDSLAAKSDLSYQPEPKDGQQCSGCAYYVPDKNGDGVGACTIVEGMIEPTGYCTSYVAHEGSTTGTDGNALAPVDAPGGR
ncbi:high-potential iron-sulfur protein [Halorubellus sp. PRR65]|uniref:high-potential iron-sulfur protein n=1 Tax=Halorubellus sp. PRR65 TaxID=3098148 RepID=UPI002B25C0EE|nr:high-potential iron-sulfur protein [Halorubellus sp. PRR65]